MKIPDNIKSILERIYNSEEEWKALYMTTWHYAKHSGMFEEINNFKIRVCNLNKKRRYYVRIVDNVRTKIMEAGDIYIPDLSVETIEI